MASFETNGLDEFALSFSELENLPDEVTDRMLQAEGEVIKRGQIASARSMLRGPYYKGGVAEGIRLGKPRRTRSGKMIKITFAGTQHGNPVSEIAFINEFGKRHQPARPFIKTANEKHAEEAVDAAAKIYDEFLSSKGL